MAVLYVDYENGNNSYGGSSFALMYSGTDGALSGTGNTTFSSASANFPNDGSLIGHRLSIYTGSVYTIFSITAWISSTSLTIAKISAGTDPTAQSSRQYYIGGRWKFINNVAGEITTYKIEVGDEIRYMASPDPTSLGQAAQWTDVGSALLATKTAAISSSTNATPSVVTTLTAHGLSIGDYVQVYGHATNTNINGLWKVGTANFTSTTISLVNDDDTNSIGNGTGIATGSMISSTHRIVKLTTPVTQTISLVGNGQGGTNSQKISWTPTTNVTATIISTDFKEGSACQQIAIGSTFTTGKAAYYTLPSQLDLSGYQQITFWIKLTSGLVGSANQTSIVLCSDTTGDTPVNTFNIPFIGAGASSATLNAWMSLTIDNGAALGNTINSIAFYVNTDNGAQTFLLDCILAVKASSANDSLSVNSLIGKNTTGEYWWPIESIKDKLVVLGGPTNRQSVSLFPRGYCGVTESVTSYKRECINSFQTNNSNTVFVTGRGGTSIANRNTYTGGYNRTDMSTKTGETWFNGRNSVGYGFAVGAYYTVLENIHMFRYSSGLNPSLATVGYLYKNCSSIGSNGNGFYTNQTPFLELDGCLSLMNGTALTAHGIGTSPLVTYKNCKSISNCGTGFYFAGAHSCKSYNNYSANNNMGYFFDGTGTENYFYNCVSEKNQYGATESAWHCNANANAGHNYLYNCIINETVEVYNNQARYGGKIYSQNHDNTAGYHKMFCGGGLIESETTVRHTASGYAWRFSVTHSERTLDIPIQLSIAKIACSANNQVTVKAWMRRNNTGLMMRLRVMKDQYGGPTTDIISNMTVGADTWEEITLQFTPTLNCVIEVFAEAYGGTTYLGYVDDVTVTQV